MKNNMHAGFVLIFILFVLVAMGAEIYGAAAAFHSRLSPEQMELDLQRLVEIRSRRPGY